MDNFIELRFGQGDLGRSVLGKRDNDDTEYYIQRQLIPVTAIKNAYVVLPEKRNIRITFDVGDGRLFTREEYYKDVIDCIKRWVMIKKACGINAKVQIMNPLPLPMDADEWEKVKQEEKKHEPADDYRKPDERPGEAVDTKRGYSMHVHGCGEQEKNTAEPATGSRLLPSECVERTRRKLCEMADQGQEGRCGRASESEHVYRAGRENVRKP